MQLNKLILLLLFIAGISSCIEPFVPITAKYENSILIEALVTDDPEIPPSVKIVRSIPLETQDEDEEISEQKPVDNAEVFIICDDGNEYMLTNQESGAYEAVNPMFTGEEGKSYKIIIYYDGEIYESDFVELKSSPEIDSIGCEVTEKNETPDGIIDTGYTFNVSTHDDSPGPSYYRWIEDATYYYYARYVSKYYVVAGHFGSVTYWEYSSLPLRNCWGTKTISGIFVAETEGLAENRIVKAPLHFESQYGDELKLRYRLRVKQLAISSENYYFWKEFDQLINQTGGLYEIVPYRLTGNIICTSNPSSNVTGIFEVAGVSEKAMYFDTPVEFPVYGYECEAVEWDLSVIDPKTGDLVWIDDATGTWYTADPECFDCTLRGGTTEMPAFWEF